VTGDDQPRTLLAVLVTHSDRTHEEHVADFNKQARRMGESATLSLRQFDRWLAGDLCTLPRATCRRVAEAHWGRPIQELLGPPRGAVEIMPQAAVSVTEGADASGEEDDMERRALLRNVLAASGVGLGVPALAVVERVRRSMDGVLDSSNVSPATIDRWERTAHEYAYSYQTVPPLQLLSDVVADFAEVQVLLAQRQPVKFRRRLCQSGAQMAVLAGVFLSAMGHQREARAWFHTAKLAAEEAGDTRLAGLAMVRSATVSFYYGAPGVALEQARASQHMLGATVCASQVRARVVGARASARLGDRDNNARALIGQAEELFGQLPSSEVDNTALGFTERQFWFTVGNAYTSLGTQPEASDAQRRALALYQPTEYLDPALIRLDQARCLVQNNQADTACELAAATIAGAPEQHRSGLIVHCGREFYNALPAPVRALPAARQLHGVLMAQG
jgi:hypothetical protein